MSDMFEIQSGKLAADKAQNEVREFGEQMVDSHTETSEELKELVEDENLDVQCAEAAKIFYVGDRFTRNGAMPITVAKLLQDFGSHDRGQSETRLENI